MRKIAVHRARDEARDLLREMIVGGELAPATHVEEIKMSAEIGVSRTPVREALIALEHEGLVRSSPRKGFVVVAPDEALVRESFPILSALEAMAVKLSGKALQDAAPKLRAINTALAREKKKARQYDLDRGLHVALTEHCGNERLLALLAMERTRAQLIDGAHSRGMANLEGSCADHGAVIGSIESGDFAKAAAQLSAHWDHGVEVVAKWLKDR